MKKLILTLFCVAACLTTVFGQGLETFNFFDYSGTAYIDGGFVGDNGITWSYYHVTGAVAGANNHQINGNGMILRRSEIPSRIVSDPIPNGIGNFSVDMRKAYTSAGDRQVALFVNGNWVADSQIFGSASGADPTIHTFAVSGVNISGNVVIEIRNIQGGTVNRQLTIDNITWTAYSGGNTVEMPVFAPVAGFYTSPVNVSITCATPAATIHYTTDGTTPSTASPIYSTPITISSTTTLKAIGVLGGYNPSAVRTGTYTFPVNVDSITALRGMTADGSTVYRLTSHAILTFKQTFRNQKFFQDTGAGILIDDLNGVITTNYNLMDGVTGLTGKLGVFGNMLQFTPVLDPGTPTSTNNTVTPVAVTLSDLIASFDSYESLLIRVNNVTFALPVTTFANGTVYPVSDGTATFGFRTTFYDVDYISTDIPLEPKDVVCIPNSRTDGNYITARSLADFHQTGGTVNPPSFNPPGGTYSNAIAVTISTTTAGAQIYYTTNGSNPTTSSTFYTQPVQIAQTTVLKAVAYLTGQPLSPVSMATYILPISVASISELRQQAPGTQVYRLTSPAVLTFKQTFRNQKFVQDDTAGILIDDLVGIITTNYNVGDGISNLTGTIAEYGGMIQLTPIIDPGVPTSTGNIPLIVDIALEELNENFNDYESRLVRLTGVYFVTAQSTFANGQVYPLSSDTANANFRTTFYDVDYIGTSIPQTPIILVGIPNSRTDGEYITARNWMDFTLPEIVPPWYFDAMLIQNDAHLNWGYFIPDRDPERIVPWGLTGYRVYRNGAMIADLEGDYHTSYIDPNLPIGNYTYHVRSVFFGSWLSDPTPDIQIIVTNNDDQVQPPLTTSLNGNYPNPFNPLTTIAYTITTPGTVRIDIFNTRGQLIRTLTADHQTAGSYTTIWDGTDSTGQGVSSGIYVYRMTAAGFQPSRKMLLMK